MTKDIFLNDADKHFENSKIEDILSYFVDSNGNCRGCVHDHSFMPTFVNAETSIDLIPKQLGKVKNVRVSG